MTKVALGYAVAKSEALYCKREVATSSTGVVTQTANAWLFVVGVSGLLFSPTHAIIYRNLKDDITVVSRVDLLKLGHADDERLTVDVSDRWPVPLVVRIH